VTGPVQLDEEVEGDEEHAENKEKGAQTAAAKRKAADGMDEAGGNDTETGFGTRQIKRTDGFKTREVAAEGGKLVFKPEGEFFAVAPEIDRAEKKDGVPEARQETKSWTSSPIEHSTSPQAGRWDQSIFVVNRDESNDFEFFLPCWSLHLYFVADFAIQKRAPNWRGGGDQSLLDIGFFTADELVFYFDALLNVNDPKARAIAGAILGDVGEIQHAEVAHALFEVADFCVDVALTLLGVLVFGVFGEVAVGASDSDLLREVNVQFVLEGVNFRLELLFNLSERVRHNFPRQRKMMRNPAEPDSAFNIIDG